jgi:hypothetical protein
MDLISKRKTEIQGSKLIINHQFKTSNSSADLIQGKKKNNQLHAFILSQSVSVMLKNEKYIHVAYTFSISMYLSSCSIK